MLNQVVGTKQIIPNVKFIIQTINYKKYYACLKYYINTFHSFYCTRSLETGIDFNFITNPPMFLIIVAICVAIKSLTVFVMVTTQADQLYLFGKCEIDRKAAVCAYVKANIGKYLPGNVIHYVERNLFADGLEISLKMVISSIIEILVLTGIALLLSILGSFQYLIELFYQILGDRYHLLSTITLIDCFFTTGFITRVL